MRESRRPGVGGGASSQLSAALRWLAMLIAAGAVAGCNGDGDGPGPDDRAPGAERGASLPADLYQRGCRAQISSAGVDVEAGSDDIVIGPVTFFSARVFATEGPAEFATTRRPPGAWGSARKSVTVVEPRVNATVIVPEEHRDSFLLLYNDRRFASSIRIRTREGTVGSGWFPRSSANAAVRFEACTALETLNRGRTRRGVPLEDLSPTYNGGFLVREPGCYELEVVSDEDAEPERATIGFGMGPEGCPGGA